jgi:hypothetical protein
LREPAPQNSVSVCLREWAYPEFASLADPAVRSRIVDLGNDVFPREEQTPGALGALQKADAAKWWPII